MTWKLGTELTPCDRQHVVAQFVHRFTREHRPDWACQRSPNGTRYQVQFASDADWLANTRFRCKANGRLDKRARHCFSNPTWPDDFIRRRFAVPAAA